MFRCGSGRGRGRTRPQRVRNRLLVVRRMARSEWVLLARRCSSLGGFGLCGREAERETGKNTVAGRNQNGTAGLGFCATPGAENLEAVWGGIQRRSAGSSGQGWVRAGVWVGVVGVGSPQSQTRRAGGWNGASTGGGMAGMRALGQGAEGGALPTGPCDPFWPFCLVGAISPFGHTPPRHPWIWQARASTSLGHPQKPAAREKSPPTSRPKPQIASFPFFPPAPPSHPATIHPSIINLSGNSMRARVRATDGGAREASCPNWSPSFAGGLGSDATSGLWMSRCVDGHTSVLCTS